MFEPERVIGSGTGPRPPRAQRASQARETETPRPPASMTSHPTATTLPAELAGPTIFERMLLAVYGSVDAAAEDLDDELGFTAFQAEGVSRLLRFIDDLGGALLADEPGLGKTYMAGEIARRYARTGRKVLIIAPAAVRDSV